MRLLALCCVALGSRVYVQYGHRNRSPRSRLTLVRWGACGDGKAVVMIWIFSYAFMYVCHLCRCRGAALMVL